MKKVFIYIAIVLGILVFACAGLAITLMLAPGTEIFGIKYISAVVGEYQTSIRQVFVSQDIYIYAHDVPINVSFGEVGTVGVEYVQHYQGFTRAKDAPEVVFKNKDGNPFNKNVDTDAVYIHVNQYKKFIWSNGQNPFYFKLNLPFEYKDNATIHIETDNSVVTVSGTQKTVKQLTVKTGRKVDIKNQLTVERLNIECNEALELGKHVKVAPISAGGIPQLNVSIPNENLTIINPINNGDITFNTAGGNLTFNTCRNLTVTSGSGNINQPASNYINGNLNFQTSSGNVSISRLNGTKHYISSTSGKIDLGFCAGDLEIITKRAAVSLGTVHNASVSSTTGDISITYVTGKIVASSTRSGDISCGTVVSNATLSTHNGDITVSGSVGGNLSLTANKGNFQMVSCQNLTAKVKEGSLVGYNNAKIIIYGTANIKSDKGTIDVYKIAGTSRDQSIIDNSIECKNGTINIGTIVGTSTINSYNAPIAIFFAGKTTISSSYSQVSINNAPNGATISNISGNIVVGSQGGTSSTGAVNIFSSEGTISVFNTTGDVYLFSNQQITLENKSSTKIFINTTKSGDTTGKGTARGKVVATNLQGEVRVCSQNDISLKFAQISGYVRVDSWGASSKVVIDATCAKESTVNYVVQSSKGVMNDLYIGQTSQQSTKFVSEKNSSFHYIKAYTTYAKIVLMLG